MYTFCPVIVVLVAVVAVLWFPWAAKYRDDRFYRPPPQLTLAGKFAADEAGWSVRSVLPPTPCVVAQLLIACRVASGFDRRWRSGTVVVRHDAATLLQAEDRQGVLPDVPAEIAYRTSFSAATAESDNAGSSVGCDAMKHVLLLHGIGGLGDQYVWSGDILREAGHAELASSLSPQLQVRRPIQQQLPDTYTSLAPPLTFNLRVRCLQHRSVAERLHDEPGVCVTTIDLRGHGDGGYSCCIFYALALLARSPFDCMALIPYCR